MLDPIERQVEALRSHCGAQRRAFNWGPDRVRANLAQRAAERSYGVPEGEVAPWWRQNSKEAYASGLANLSDALGNWNASRAGQRNGPIVRFPRFKSKRTSWSCRFSTGSFGPAASDRKHVKLPRIGTVRTHESTRKLARYVEAGRARIRSATVSFRRGRWQVPFSVEIEQAAPKPATRGGAVGVDLGVKSPAVLSTGETTPNPRHLDRAQRELRRLQRRASCRLGPDKHALRPPSNRWRTTQQRINRLHAYVANARTDGLHKLSTRLMDEFDTIVVENLNVSGMVRNRRLSRAISDVGMGELRRQATYKATRNERRLLVADRWYPSSKTCSACGAVKTKLRLSERTHHCGTCGHTADRDHNAARNLAALADDATGSTSTESCAGRINMPAGNPRKTGHTGTGYRHGKTAPSVANAT